VYSQDFEWAVRSYTGFVCRACIADKISAEVVREKVQDGLTGETREIQYTQCKIVGNGSFGVVFQTKLSPSGEDAAIKRVLQDKRFKVLSHQLDVSAVADLASESRAPDHAHRSAPQYR
jgi:hypothetical protein